jgi:site-specific recombinase XerD
MTDRDLSPREAADRFIGRREKRNTHNTVRSYRNRLQQFVTWAEDEGIESMSELDGWLLDEYCRYIQSTGVAPATAKGKISSVDQLLQYCVSIDVVDEDLPDKLDIPTLTEDEETSDEMLAAEDARPLLEFFRNSTREYGTPQHVLLEVMWHIGGRMSCYRALDLEDWDPEDRVLKFRSRPPTRLKDGSKHERNVVVSEEVADALEFYIGRERPQKRDENGRKPLFSTRHGRASESTFRCWSYQATQPCFHMACPHNRRRDKCEYTERIHSSKCPSSRGPHAVRTGSITWQLNRGLSYVKVAKRVAASPETIRRYYDKPDLEEELARRRPDTENMDLVSGEVVGDE